MFDKSRKGRHEGVTVFEVDHAKQALSPSRYERQAIELSAWRSILSDVGLIGQDAQRYDGIGFGNLSCRTAPISAGRGRRSFLVTGSQTGHLSQLTLDNFARVTQYDWRANRVSSEGLCPPSSESMTHGAVYDLAPSIRYIFHVHAPSIWSLRRRLKLPETGACIEYGTPQMADAISELRRHSLFWSRQAFAMAGHEDGIVTFGKTAQEAGSIALALLAQARQIVHGPVHRSE